MNTTKISWYCCLLFLEMKEKRTVSYDDVDNGGLTPVLCVRQMIITEGGLFWSFI